MLRLVTFAELLYVVLSHHGGKYPWLGLRRFDYFSMPISKIDKFDEFRLCTGWTKADLNTKDDGPMYMFLSSNSEHDKPRIDMSVLGKRRTINFEFGKEYNDTLLSGKKATAVINLKESPKSAKLLLFDIEEKLEDGVVVSHNMEIDTEAPPPYPPKSYAMQGKCKCKNIEIFTGWYWTH